MSRARSVHRCRSCGAVSYRWSGRCGSCRAWNTLVEEVAASSTGRPSRSAAEARPVTEIDGSEACPRPTGLAELDRVLSGGLVPGSVTVLGGEPGIGKSTLALQTLSSVARLGSRTLLVTAEESARQARARAERLGAVHPDLWLLAETSLPAVMAAVSETDPAVAVIDSVQAVTDPETGSAPGTVAQVSECARQLVELAKAEHLSVVLVGHVTKEGSLAGPRLLEHAVDTVLTFEGDRHHALRTLRAVKHRFGPTGEVGLFAMDGSGLVTVEDPGALLLGDRRAGAPGGVVVAALEGRRCLLVELQVLVTPSSPALPRRSVQGVDASRLAMVIAVLERHVGMAFRGLDVFASVTGGVRTQEPGTDLALALALASAASGAPVPGDVVACGEIGLGGEIRQVAHTDRRLAEAARGGFRRAVVPPSAPDPPEGISVVRVSSVAEAVSWTSEAGGAPNNVAGPSAADADPARLVRASVEE